MTKPIRKLTHSVRKRGRKIRALLSLAKNKTGGFARVKFAKKRDPQIYKCKGSVDYAVATDYAKDLVTIAVISKDGYDLIRPCIESIQNHCGKHNIEIIIGDTGTTNKRVLKYYRTAQKRFRNIRFVRFEKYFFSRNYNELVSLYANGEYLVLLNNDTIATSGWLDALIAPLADKRIGIVGAKLLSRDLTIQHAGIEYNNEGHGYHVFRNEPSDLPAANIASIVPGLTFACVAMRHDVYDRFQLSEDFLEEAQDTDFCLRLSVAGFDILYEPKAELFHFEGSSRDWRKGESDRILLNKIWDEHIRKLLLVKHQRKPFNNDAFKDAIIVIRDDGVGDLLMGISSFKMLRDRHQNQKLILLTYERNIAMMESFGIFDEILPIPNGKKYSPLPVPTKGTTVSNLIDIEMDFGGQFAVSKDDNMVHRHIAFTRKFRLDANTYSSVPLKEYPKAKASIHQILLDMGCQIDLPFVSFNLMATNPARSWWEPYYPALIEAVERMGFVPLFIGTEASPHLRGKNAINLIGKTNSIPEYIEALKFGKYIISSDTSACHIAALAGIPFLAIFTGGVRAKARLNYYQKYEVIEPEGLDCFPCWDVGCKDPALRWKKDPCRLMLTPEAVIAKFETLVKKYPVAPV
ncbi:MAG: glycosyltransferase [Chlorobiaceae bacterium]